MRFYEMSPEVAAAAADLYRVNSPRRQCACGFWTFNPNEHGRHRSGSAGDVLSPPEPGCDATWTP
jgi:hypothetical protein